MKKGNPKEKRATVPLDSTEDIRRRTVRGATNNPLLTVFAYESMAAYENHLAALPDGPEKEARMLLHGAEQWSDRADGQAIQKLLDDPTIPPEMRAWKRNQLLLSKRLELMYLDELQAYGQENGRLEEMILRLLSACFVTKYGLDWVYKLFARLAAEMSRGARRPKEEAVKPRTTLTDRKNFVLAYIISGQKPGEFAKRVAEINAALPPDKRFGCLSTDLEEVKRQLNRARKEWEDILRKEMFGGQE